MANDRMFLRCPCGDRFTLAKNLGTAWFGSQLGNELDAWFKQHQFCDADPPEGWYPAHPTLVYESDDWPEGA